MNNRLDSRVLGTVILILNYIELVLLMPDLMVKVNTTTAMFATRHLAA